MPEEASGSSKQKVQYERIHEEYESTYFDEHSIRYRERFIFAPLFHGLDLNGLHVAELACGSGYNSLALLSSFPKAKVTGFDISSKACQAYRELTGHESFELDLTRGWNGDQRFDAAMILSGLHHCVVDLPATLQTVASMVKPGGHLLIAEPSSEFLLESFRKLWYRADGYFDADTEEALAHDEIMRLAAPYFEAEFVKHMGGPAYFLVLNSLIFRIPPGLKSVISGPAMWLESIYNWLPGRWPYPHFIARWKRTGQEVTTG